CHRRHYWCISRFVSNQRWPRGVGRYVAEARRASRSCTVAGDARAHRGRGNDTRHGIAVAAIHDELPWISWRTTYGRSPAAMDSRATSASMSAAATMPVSARPQETTTDARPARAVVFDRVSHWYGQVVAINDV